MLGGFSRCCTSFFTGTERSRLSAGRFSCCGASPVSNLGDGNGGTQMSGGTCGPWCVVSCDKVKLIVYVACSTKRSIPDCQSSWHACRGPPGRKNPWRPPL